jgi:hypothetical protein
VEIALVGAVAPGEVLLVHAGTALARAAEGTDAAAMAMDLGGRGAPA